jgi:hypothetical protein
MLIVKMPLGLVVKLFECRADRHLYPAPVLGWVQTHIGPKKSRLRRFGKGWRAFGDGFLFGDSPTGKGPDVVDQ